MLRSTLQILSTTRFPLLLFPFLLLSCFPVQGQVVLLPEDEPILNSDSIDRGELARVLISYLPQTLLVKLSGGLDVPGPDEDEQSLWKFLNTTGILPPFTDGSNYPRDKVSRSQMALIMNTIVDKLPVIPGRTDISPAPLDVDTLRYDWIPIREVVSLGLMPLDGQGLFNPDRPITGREAVESAVSFSRYATAWGNPAGKKTP